MKHLSFFPDLVILMFFIVNDIFFILNRLFFFFLLGFVLIASLTSIILRDVSVEKLDNLILSLLKLFLSH
jgi:hypothetical protein